MADTSPHYVNEGMRERIDRLFYGLEYEVMPVDEWLEGDTEPAPEPLSVWYRELLGRDILRGHEVTAQDTLVVSAKACGELIMERFVYLDTEDDDEVTIDHYVLNMYSGEIDALYPEGQQYPVQNFENRFRIVEDL